MPEPNVVKSGIVRRAITLRGIDSDPRLLRAFMLFPEKEDRRDEFMNLDDLNHLKQSLLQDPTEPVIMCGTTGARLVNAIPSPGTVRFGLPIERGLVAGQILAFTHAMSLDARFGHAGVIKARETLAWINRSSHRIYSATTLKECWTEFRSVAHLWAALFAARNFTYVEHVELPSGAALYGFCALATGYRNFGIQFGFKNVRSDSDNRYLLIDNTCWTLAGQMQLAAIDPTPPARFIDDLLSAYLRQADEKKLSRVKKAKRKSRDQ